MKRWLVPLALLAGCGDPPCDEATCRWVCAERAREAHGAAVENGAELSEAEMNILRPYLEEARMGPLLVRPDALRVCRGVGRCEQPLGLQPEGWLPDGHYMLSVELTVPRLTPPDGWKLTVRGTCFVVKPDLQPADREIDLSIPLTPAPGGNVFRVEQAMSFDSPATDGETKCQLKVGVAGLEESQLGVVLWQVPLSPDVERPAPLDDRPTPEEAPEDPSAPPPDPSQPPAWGMLPTPEGMNGTPPPGQPTEEAPGGEEPGSEEAPAEGPAPEGPAQGGDAPSP